MTYDKKKYENDAWAIQGHFPSFVSCIHSQENINGRIIQKIVFNNDRINSVKIDITDKCKVGGCPLAICESCVNFMGVDWNEIFETYVIPELEKERGIYL